jgi:hypothetical protein
MAEGYAVTAPVLSANDCTRLVSYFDDPAIEFRSRIDMARHNFGRGEYKYFAYPLPPEIRRLREFFYAGLAPIANAWEQCLGNPPKWPDELAALTRYCHAAGQCRPTPLMLRYREGDYNCLHQDLYGDIHFPLQVVVMLSDPQEDFAGGELVLVEQRPRMQSRPIVVHLEQGRAAIIPVRERPREGSRGYHRAKMRHGVAQISAGNRTTLGVIFHDAV